MFLMECVDVEFEVWAGLWEQRVGSQNLNKIKQSVAPCRFKCICSQGNEE